jgi:DNA ligase (NAD+)
MADSPEFFPIPTECPSCFGPLSIEGDFLYCRSKKCPARLFGDVKVWVDRLGLLFWGDAFIGSLTDPDKPNSISSVADLYKMSIADFEEHCSGLKMARKCWKVLHDSMSVPLEVVISGMNIPNLGLSTATDIVKAGYNTVESIVSISVEQLVLIPNVGGTTAKQIRAGLDVKGQLLKDLSLHLDIRSSDSGPLAGKKICITGDVWAPRKAVQKLIVSAGGRAVDSVSKDTDILVCDNASSSSGKSKKAVAYGIPIISGSDLKRVIDGEIYLNELTSER